jgi:hypothetical protein
MRDLLEALNRWQAQYLVIGAHAVGVYAEPRGTKDLDIWVNPTKENAKRVYAALTEFGAPPRGSTEKTLTNKQEFLVIGVAPNRIDILKSIPGPGFRACWKNRRTGSSWDRRGAATRNHHCDSTARLTRLYCHSHQTWFRAFSGELASRWDDGEMLRRANFAPPGLTAGGSGYSALTAETPAR